MAANPLSKDNVKFVGEKVLEGGEVVVTALNDTIQVGGQKIKEGGEVVLTSLKTDFNELAGEFTNEFSAFDIHQQAGETTCQMVWRLWLLIFLAINAVILIGATIFIFIEGDSLYRQYGEPNRE